MNPATPMAPPIRSAPGRSRGPQSATDQPSSSAGELASGPLRPPGSGARTGIGRGAALVAVIAASSPFDVARPLDGWTDLHLRPLLLGTAVLAGVLVLARRRSVDRPIAAATLALVMGFAVAAAASVDTPTGLAVTTRVAVLGLVFVAASTVVTDARARRTVLFGVAIGAVGASLLGLVVLVGGGDRWGTDALVGSISVSRGVTRLTRPFSHANVAAMYLAPASVLLAGSVSGRRSQRARSIVLGGAALLAAAALSVTLSRSGVVAVVVAAVGLALARCRTGMAARSVEVALPLATALLALGGGVASGRWGPRLGLGGPADADAAISSGSTTAWTPGRLGIWGQAFDAWSQHPWTGVGPGRFGAFSRSVTNDGEVAVAHAHQPVLEVVATGGLVALVGLALFLATVLWRARVLARAVPFGLTAALVAALIPMAVDNPLLFSSSGNLVAVLAGSWVGSARSWPR